MGSSPEAVPAFRSSVLVVETSLDLLVVDYCIDAVTGLCFDFVVVVVGSCDYEIVANLVAVDAAACCCHLWL